MSILVQLLSSSKNLLLLNLVCFSYLKEFLVTGAAIEHLLNEDFLVWVRELSKSKQSNQ